MGQLDRSRSRTVLATATTLSLVAALWTVRPEARAEAAYTPGSALAEAAPFGVNVIYNNANVGFSAAVSNAGYASTSATATATPYAFGLLSLIDAVTLCGEHPVPPGVAPTPLTARSDEGDGQPVERSSGSDQGFALGSGHVRAVPGADARADTTAAAFDLAGIARVSGGEAHARAATDEQSRTRLATGDSRADVSLLGGLIRLTGMSFHLEQTSVGDDARTTERTVSSAVSFGSLSLAGVPLPLPDAPAAAAERLNSLLAPLGVQVLAPQLVAEGQFGQRLTPMIFRLGGDSAYSDLVAQLASTPQLIELQDQIQKGLFDTQSCDQLAGLMKPMPQINALYNAIGVAAPILLAVVVNALAGGGSIDVQVGGARTRIDDTLYLPPTFSRPMPALPTTASPPPATAPVPVPAPAPTAVATAPPTSAVPTDALAAPPPLTVASATHCVTASPAARPGCWSGLAPVGAVGAFVLFGVLLAIDEIRRRRLTRLEPTEIP